MRRSAGESKLLTALRPKFEQLDDLAAFAVVFAWSLDPGFLKELAAPLDADVAREAIAAACSATGAAAGRAAKRLSRSPVRRRYLGFHSVGAERVRHLGDGREGNRVEVAVDHRGDG